MGMFDTVHFPCPHCGEDAEVQTKAGPCQLNDYTLDNVTGAIAESLRSSDYPYKTCSACGGELKFEAVVQVTIKVTKP